AKLPIQDLRQSHIRLLWVNSNNVYLISFNEVAVLSHVYLCCFSCLFLRCKSAVWCYRFCRRSFNSCCSFDAARDGPELPLQCGFACRVRTNRILHMKTLLMGAGAALLLLTSTAVADGVPRRAASGVVCCEPSWTGFYIGVGGGGAFAQHEHSARLTEE